LGVLAAAAVLAGCGGGSTSTGSDTHSAAPTQSSSSARAAGSSGATESRQMSAAPLSDEEMREYDANEGRCKDDGGVVHNIGTLDAYCAFADRSNDFHLIESSAAVQSAQAGGEEE
jgi:hypothetical protein